MKQYACKDEACGLVFSYERIVLGKEVPPLLCPECGQETVEPYEYPAVVYTMTDQPTTCPKCGTRSDWKDEEDGGQEHTCPRCNYVFIVAPEESTAK